MLNSPHTSKIFANGNELAETLAQDISAILQDRIEDEGHASIAVSGGRTPERFLSNLFRKNINWKQVRLTLADDRCVPHQHERSNLGLIRRVQANTPGAKATLIPLTEATSGNARLDLDLDPLDVLVLGMGTDGHTASLFPRGNQLSSALDPAGPRILTIEAPGAAETRVTLSLSTLLSARQRFLHIEGEAKAATLERALQRGAIEEMPIRAVLGEALNLYYAPLGAEATDTEK